MKKFFTFFAALLMAGSMMAQDVMEINLTDRNSTHYGTDVMITYSNAEYKVVLDVLTNFQWAAGQSYGLANVDNEFSFVEEISTSRRYLFTALTFVFGANMEDVEVTGTAVNGSETISIHAVYPAAPGEEEEGDETVSEVIKYSNFTQVDATATSYQDYTYASTSGATYKAHMMYQATDDKMQIRSTLTASTYYSGIVNTVAPAGKYIKSVSVEWEAGTADTRQLNIFTVDAPMAINDMYANGATANYTATKSEGDKKIDVTGQHSYIGLCSQAGAMYIKSITIEWAGNEAPTALENVEAVKAVKVIENGQVIIIRDGKRFNLMGAEL